MLRSHLDDGEWGGEIYNITYMYDTYTVICIQ